MLYLNNTYLKPYKEYQIYSRKWRIVKTSYESRLIIFFNHIRGRLEMTSRKFWHPLTTSALIYRVFPSQNPWTHHHHPWTSTLFMNNQFLLKLSKLIFRENPRVYYFPSIIFKHNPSTQIWPTVGLLLSTNFAHFRIKVIKRFCSESKQIRSWNYLSLFNELIVD